MGGHTPSLPGTFRVPFLGAEIADCHLEGREILQVVTSFDEISNKSHEIWLQFFEESGQ
jgi:hypothetical protein